MTFDTFKLGVTAHEVASLAKVSQSAVSRTFTPGASVSDATREKVLQAAKKLGYRPNALARSLITRRSHMIALVMSYLENQFYPLVIEKLSQKLQQQGYHLLMFISDEAESDGVLAEILQYQVDGIVMASTMLSADMAKSCADFGVPVVFFNRVPDSTPAQNSIWAAGSPTNATSSVTSDNYQGGRMVAQLLLETGHKRIAFLAGLEQSSTNVERERGFNDVLGAAGVSIYRRGVGHYSAEGAKTAARAMFSDTKPARRPDAVFVANDHMAMAAMDVLRIELGLRIPQDVSVVGFDDVPQAAWGSYQLTTVTQSVEDMVGATVELLNQQMQGDAATKTAFSMPSKHIKVACKLVQRQSVRAISIN